MVFVLSPLCLYAEWKTVDGQDLTVPGGKLRASELRITDGNNEAKVSFVYFAAGDIALETVPNLDGQNGDLRKIVEAKGAIAGINGGYFDESLAPIGLLISNGRLVHGLQKAKILSGIFYVKGGRPSLSRTQEFPGLKGVREAIQCGPFLIDGGRVVPGLEDSRVAARTFVFSCNASVWGFGICRSVTLQEMGRILAEASLVPGHQIIRALNFDGGSSTTFYVNTEKETIFSEGRPMVSDYLIAKPKH